MVGFFLRLKELFSQKWRRCGRGALAVAMLLALCGAGVWGATYTWTGNAGNNNWDDANNWNPNVVPGASDNVNIPYSANPLTFTNVINVASLMIDAQNSVEFTGTVNVGTLYVHANSSLNFAADLTVTNFYVYANYGVSTVPITISGGSASIDNYSYNLNGQGSLSDESVVTVDSGATLNIGSGTIPTLVNNGTVNATGSVTVNDYSGSGSKTGSLTILSGGTTDTYYWIGEGAANTWNDGNNWSTDDPTTATAPFTHATNYPQTSDIAIFNTTVAQSFSENITVDKIEIASDAEIEFSGTVTVGEIENNGKITSSNLLTLSGYSGSGEIENSGTLKINSASDVTIPTITNSGTVENIGAGALTITTLTMATDCEIKNSAPNASPRTTGQIVIETLSGNTAATATLNSVNGQNIVVNTFGNSPKIATSGLNILLNGGTISSLETASGSIVGLQGDLKVDGDFTNSGSVISFGGTSNSITVNGNLVNNGKLGDSGSNRELSVLTVTGTTTNNAGASILTTGDQTYTGAVTNSGTITVPDSATLTLGSNFTNTGTFTMNSTSKIIANGNASQTINFGTTIDVESFTYSPTAAAQTLTITTPASPQSSLGDFTATTNTGNAKIIINGKNTFNNFTTKNVLSITMGGDNTFIGDFTATGDTNITLSGSNTFNNFSFTGDTADVATAQLTLGGANSFTNFEFTNGDKLTLNAAQTVTGTLTLSGKSSSNKLYVTGSGGSFVVSADQTAMYLSVSRNNIPMTGGICTAYYSVDADNMTSEILNGWKIVSDFGTIVWTGGDGTTAWETAGNWEPKIVPGIDAATNCDVLIPNQYPTGTNITIFPITDSGTYTVNKITIESGSNNPSLTIAANSITISEIVNDGKLITNAGFEITNYSGGGSIENTANLTFNLSAATTITEITNFGTIENIGTGALTITTLIMAGDTDITNTSGSVTVGKLTGEHTATLQRTTGSITIDEYGTTNVPEIIVDGSDVFLGGGTIASLTVKANSTAELKADLTVSGDVTVGAGAYIESDKGNAGNYNFVISGNLVNNGVVGNGASGNRALTSLKVTGTTNVGSTGKIETTGNQTYTGNITNDGKIIVGGDLSISGTDEFNPLTVDGAGQFNLTSEQKAKYLVVGTNVKICNSTGANLASGDYLCKALRSKFSDGATGIKNGWCIVGDTITWTGSDATNPTAWSEPNNWDVKIVPGITNANPDDDTTVYKVVIPVKYPVGTGTDISNFPVAAAAYIVKDLTIGGDDTITDSMAAGVPSVTLGADDIVLTGTLANYGKIIYSSEGRIVDGSANPLNDTANKGTVEYSSGATTLTDFGSGEGDDYYNLIVDAELSGNGNNEDIVVAGDMEIKASKKIAESASDKINLTVEGDFKLAGALQPITSLTVKGSTEIVSGGLISNVKTQNYYGDVENNGLISFSVDGDIIFGANFTNASTGSFAIGSSTVTITATGTSATIDCSARAITATNFIYNPLDSSGDPAPNGASLTIKSPASGENTFTDFTASGLGGAKLIINGTQTVSGTLSLSGNSFNDLLTIDVDIAGNFTIKDDQFGEFLKVKRNSVSIKTSVNAPAGTTYYYYATDSLYDSVPLYGEHKRWIIFNENMEFIWTGADATNPTAWSEPTNWNMKFVPGLDEDKPNGRPIDTRGYNVLIPVQYDYGSGAVPVTQFPTVSAEYTIGNLTIGDSSIMDSMAEPVSPNPPVPSVTLSSADNLILAPKTGEATIVNYGRIIYSAEGRIIDNATPTPNFKNDVANKGTVQYSGSATTLTNFDAASGNDYANLEIAANVTNDADIIVGLKTSFIGDVSATVKTFTFKSYVKTSSAATINGDVYLSNNAANTNSTIGNGTDSFVINGNLHVASSAKKTIASSLTATNILLYSGTLEANANLSTTGDVVLLGAGYDVDDMHDGAADSDQTGLFAYNHTARDGTKHAAVSYNGILPPAFPDGSSINITTGNGILTVASGKTITAGKNFYANGVEITGTGTWTLSLPNSDNQKDAFAELYNSTIENCTVNGGVIAAAEKNNVTNCNGVEPKRPLIKEAYTVYDDVIFVSFGYDDGAGTVAGEAFIENSNNEISAAVAHIFHKVGGNANVVFDGAYTDADCQTSTNGKGDISSFYIKTVNKWNTDASGISAGVSSESTDRSGTHRTAVPYLNLPKAFADLYETLRDKYKNRIAHYYTTSPDLSAMSDAPGKTYTKVEDHCAPVLVAVYTGQELHSSDIAQQKYYDAHNFIEYRYSEQVAIGDGTISIIESDVNIQATEVLGAVTNAEDTGFTMAGLGIFSQGKIEAALRPEKTGEPHSLYRNFSLKAGDEAINNPYKIRVAVAGYVDGEIEGGYKNWTGYISSAVCPQTGVATVLPDANLNITDLAADALGNPKKNALDSTGAANHAIVPITVNAELVTASVSTLELYGTWDVTPPSFAPMRVNEMATWERPATDGTAEYEIVGMSYSEGMLSAVEFHMFDNEPTYEETLQWFSRIGWAEVNPSEPTEYSEIKSYAADIIGGSRPYSQNSTTSGGIRYSSVYDATDAFDYSASEEPFKKFSGVQQFAQSSYFKYIGGDKNPVDTIDGHYLSLALNSSDTMLSGETNFVVNFDSEACFITDLAGNRIQCGKITMKSIDRAPPAFNVSAVPLGNKKMLIVFAKALNVGNLELYKNSSSKQTVNALENIPKSLSLVDADGNPTDIQITDDPAQCVFRSKKATGIIVTLNREATLSDVVNGTYITVGNGGTNWYDPLCGTIGEVTYIQDEVGNYIRVGRQHAFSDFAVNAIQMQYAYPILDHSLDKYDTNQGTFIIRDWNDEQERTGYITENKEVILHALLKDGTDNNSGGLNTMLQDTSNSVTAYFDASPSKNSVGDKINNLMQGERTWRIWLPSTQGDVFENFASENNIAEFSVDGEIMGSSNPEENRFVNFDIPQEISTENWKAGDQVSFLFKLGNYKIRHNGPDEDPQPLYCLRLKDSLDLTSLDLWSFKMKDIALQRGGVTILANVINVNAKEKTTVQVDMQESGNLSVMVMTLDGNIVKYLHHGKAEKGTHYYLWDGTNKGGSPVARGLYFVRVIGPGIDETRKVMCVKK